MQLSISHHFRWHCRFQLLCVVAFFVILVCSLANLVGCQRGSEQTPAVEEKTTETSSRRGAPGYGKSAPGYDKSTPGYGALGHGKTTPGYSAPGYGAPGYK